MDEITCLQPEGKYTRIQSKNIPKYSLLLVVESALAGYACDLTASQNLVFQFLHNIA